MREKISLCPGLASLLWTSFSSRYEDFCHKIIFYSYLSWTTILWEGEHYKKAHSKRAERVVNLTLPRYCKLLDVHHIVYDILSIYFYDSLATFLSVSSMSLEWCSVIWRIYQSAYCVYGIWWWCYCWEKRREDRKHWMIKHFSPLFPITNAVHPVHFPIVCVWEKESENVDWHRLLLSYIKMKSKLEG